MANCRLAVPPPVRVAGRGGSCSRQMAEIGASWRPGELPDRDSPNRVAPKEALETHQSESDQPPERHFLFGGRARIIMSLGELTGLRGIHHTRAMGR